jgi:hypothetical protein
MPIRPETEMEGPAPPAVALPTKRGSSDELGVYDDARTYYTAEERHRIHRAGPRTRTYSQVGDGVPRDSRGSGQWLMRIAGQNSLLKQMERLGSHEPYRRGSHGMDNPDVNSTFSADKLLQTRRRSHTTAASLSRSSRRSTVSNCRRTQIGTCKSQLRTLGPR